MQVTGTRQREAWRRAEFPPVEKVTGGVWSVPVPIIGNPLRYVLSYLIEHDAGFVMVDPGWNHPDSWQALTTGLAECRDPAECGDRSRDHARASGPPRPVRQGARGVRRLGRHAPGRGRVPGDAGQPRAHARWHGVLPALVRRSGEPPRGTHQPAGSRPARSSRWCAPTGMIEHGDLIDVPGLRLRAVWTPGHTPGHLCFHDETHDLLLTGDHILPRITPNVSSYDLTDNPLEEYLGSLEKLRGLQPARCCPRTSTGSPTWTPGSTTWPSITRSGWPRPQTSWLAPGRPGLTAWQVATGVTWSRPWSRPGLVPAPGGGGRGAVAPAPPAGARSGRGGRHRRRRHLDLGHVHG